MAEAALTCRICGVVESSHAALNHEFSLDGQLRAKRPTPKPSPVRVIRTADTELRALLIGKGIITAEELNLLPMREEGNVNQDSSQAPKPDRPATDR